MVYRFRFLLDGLGDASVAGALTASIFKELALPARSDPAGMWLEIESPSPITEKMADSVTFIARRFGLELRDRVGTTFQGEVTWDELTRRLAFEWTSRFATGLVFLIPSVLLHYLTPSLAIDGKFIPRFLEGALVGWSIIAAAWPALYQAGLALAALRMTPDLFAVLLMIVTFLHGVLVTVVAGPDTSFHVTAFAVIALSFQRMLLWRSVRRREGRAHLMVPTSRLLAAALAIALGLLPFDFDGALSFLMAIPAMLGLLAINRLLPGVLLLFPVLLFAVFLAGAPLIVPDAIQSEVPGGLTLARVEAALVFNMVLAFALTRG